MTQKTVILNTHYQPYYSTQMNLGDLKFIMSLLIFSNHQECVLLQQHQHKWFNLNVVIAAKIMDTHKLLLAVIRILFEMEITFRSMVKLTIQEE